MKSLVVPSLVVGVAANLAVPVYGADPASVNWGVVPTHTLTLFYPGQSSYQWLRGPEHAGAQPVAGGMACVACHKDAEEKLGNNLVKANRLEPTPVEGKNGALRLSLQVAYDAQNAYFRAQWRTRNNFPGDAYLPLRFDGKEWKVHGGPRLDRAVRSGEKPAIYEDRFSIIIDDGKVPGFANQGCWLTCHDGQRDLKPAGGDAVKANPLFQRLKVGDVRKYLPATRTDALASWDKGRSPEEIAGVKSSGGFLELMQWRAHRSNAVGMADDGYVLEYRLADAGRNPFGSNFDAKAGQPRFMYDEKKVGRKALSEADLRKMPSALVREQNAVPFDPNAGWKAGDLIPSVILSRVDATGSAADNKQAKGEWKDGTWTVVWARPLNLANPDDKAIKEGAAYNFSVAVHDDNITTRGHHVSFPVTVGFGAKAAIQATRLR